MGSNFQTNSIAKVLLALRGGGLVLDFQEEVLCNTRMSPESSVLARIWIFQKKELLKFFRELFAKERSYPSTAKILRMYIQCAYYMPEHIAII